MGKLVIGLGFGDEGKGLTTSFLTETSHYQPLIVRANGGQQAGHTVCINGKRHVFSNFGSGTLQGAPTLWTHFCTFCPASVVIERRALVQLGIEPKLLVHGLCPVTTHYDVKMNQVRESVLRHGSVGVGFGATIKRQEDYYKLYVQDLLFPSIVKAKLANIANYYGVEHDPAYDEIFLQYCTEVLDYITIESGLVYERLLTNNLTKNFAPIFEGAQGILLDMDYGFFPNVTRSNTTSRNPFAILNAGTTSFHEIYYVTRTYQTRHGNGFMTNEHLSNEYLSLTNTENETNKTDEWQGEFRKTILDIDLLLYALKCDSYHSDRIVATNHLVITCADQTGKKLIATHQGNIIEIDPLTLYEIIKKCSQTPFVGCYLSSSPESTLEKIA